MSFDVQAFDVAKFDALLARGLSKGLGTRGGMVCVEAALCEVLNLPHGDDPGCVSATVRSFKIALNDLSWSSPKARAAGLRDLGLAQLGSLGVVSDQDFLNRLSEKVIRRLVPHVFRRAPHGMDFTKEADACERDGSRKAAVEASRVAQAAQAAWAAGAAWAAEAAQAAQAAGAAQAAAHAAWAAQAAWAAWAAEAARAAWAAGAAWAARAAGAAGAAGAARAAWAAGAAWAAWAAGAAETVRAAWAAGAAEAAAGAAETARAALAAGAEAAAEAAAAAQAAESNPPALVPDFYLIMAAQLALETLRELHSPGCQLLDPSTDAIPNAEPAG